jgi:hypothetical protein
MFKLPISKIARARDRDKWVGFLENPFIQTHIGE